MRMRHRWAHWSVLAVLHIGALPAAAQGSVPVQLTIEVRDLAPVPPAVMRETRTEVERTFEASGVRIVWVEPGRSSQDPTPLRLYVVGGSPMRGRDDGESGVTTLGFAPHSGHWAQVFYGRVAAAVAERPVSVSLILAHVIAHELGHLLLPPNSHGSFGIMRRAVELDHPALRRFTGEQSRLIRAALESGRRYASRCNH